MAPAEPSVTRRSLRAAERAACGNADEPVVPQARTEPTLQPSRRGQRSPARTHLEATVRASVRRVVARFEPQPGQHSHTAPATRAPHRASRPTWVQVSRRYSSPSRMWAPQLGQAPALGLALSVLMVIGGIGYVHTDNLDRADQAAAVAVAAEQSRRDRVDDAAADRLNGLATAIASERRQEALVAARTAFETADAVVVVAAQLLAAETVSSLGAAAAQLAEMAQQNPDPLMPSVDLNPLATTGSTLTSTATDPATAEPATDPATAEPAADPATEEPAAVAGSTTNVRLEEGALGRVAERPAAETLAALDLETSARMLEFAQQVSQLTEQVKAASDVASAELAAAAQAAAEQAAQQAAAAAAAAERAAASIHHKIEIADASPNGQIPREVLCDVAFDSETLLRCDAAGAFEQLNAAYRQQFGRNLSVTSSYRDFDGQVEARNARGGLAATPGTSNHGRGLAADLDGFGDVGQFDTPSYVWMAANAGAFGWIHPSYMGPGGSGPLEPWHWEYGTE